jgi:FMN phosphatase YigB (HAD superfamily)
MSATAASSATVRSRSASRCSSSATRASSSATRLDAPFSSDMSQATSSGGLSPSLRSARGDSFKPAVAEFEPVAVSFDLFDTLVEVTRPADPAAAVADALRAREVSVPGDFGVAYREPHVDAPDGAEVALPVHVAAALRSRGVAPSDAAVRRAVVDAFDPVVETRPGAAAAVDAAAARGPVACLSNCSVPGLVRRTLVRSAVDREPLVVVTSAGCGWRKPDPRAFEAVAGRLGVPAADLVHVGDDPRTDGGVTAVGGRFLDAEEVPLAALGDRLADGGLG